MANLSSLIHELRERIAASASAPSSSSSGEDPLETKFRTVLPNLLHAYVVPSSTGTGTSPPHLSPSSSLIVKLTTRSPAANEREVTAVLKLLSHTARNFPGVFYHGRAAAVLPVIGRVLPFLAEPAFRYSSLIRATNFHISVPNVRSFSSFLHLNYADVVYIASSYVKKSRAFSDGVSLKCFNESFALISKSPALFSELPACCRPLDGPGVLVDLTDKTRWQPFAAWTIRLVNKCLMEGTLYVEGLVNVSFAYAVCSLLCYGDATLHMVGQDDKEFVAFRASQRRRSLPEIIVCGMVVIANREAGERLLHLDLDLVCVAESGYNKDGWCPVRLFPWILAHPNTKLHHPIVNYSGVLQSQMKLFQDDDSIDTDSGSCSYLRYADLLELLKLPWTNNSVIAEACLVSKVKCLCIQAFSKIGIELKDESDLELLDLAMHDESEEVCSEAITSMPVIILCSGQIFLGSMLRKLE
ncbi:hypothetical protein GW17_00017663 [Ensete ventricosum]|nr:hypothetical protein GW17_00017663 [Ensete ventricosum]